MRLRLMCRPTTGRAHGVFNVESKEAVFCEKNHNVENQTGACFIRSKEIFRLHAIESMEMINDVHRKKTTFSEQMQVCHQKTTMRQ
jgi:hypothetical protein